MPTITHSVIEEVDEISERRQIETMMEVEFADPDLERLESDARFAAGFQPAVVKGFRKRMQIIRSAADERDLYQIKGNRFERLKGKREGQSSLVLSGNWRLIIELKKTPQGPTKIKVIEIVDYH